MTGFNSAGVTLAGVGSRTVVDRVDVAWEPKGRVPPSLSSIRTYTTFHHLSPPSFTHDHM